MTSTRDIQRRLIALGYDVGPAGADGIPGRNTTKAVARFQDDKNIQVLYRGTVGPKTLKALGLDETEQPIPPWVLEGQRKLGLHEKLNNTALKAYLKSDGQTLGDPAKLPWCGDFMETIIALTLPKEPVVTNPYWAANWLKFGKPVPKDEFYMGAIGVKARTGGNHVFTIVGHDKTHVHAMGGNQSDSISIVKIKKSDITGMRFPTTYPFPTKQMPLTVFNGKLSVKED
ncbi:peptidoglycan-binding protein [Agrobacterium rubi]|uniref:NlpC/P60 family protein n=1 Tax=Agrobacterium rubi TaxID=28099 RepID=UPI00157164C5|nr:peptidoglycan-binding protein [Agrobacterium rubi]NTE87183.1 TIGR02594 family protein [Agrobacterium rubi]NTF03117.1 TIGR02594 family protein [Agrobacterium rubi]